MKKDLHFLTSLFADAYRHVPGMVVKSQILQLLSAFWSTVIGFVAFATFYGLEKGSVSYFGETFEIGSGDAVLIGMFVALGFALCAQSILFYLENTAVNRLCRNYEEINVERAIARIHAMSVADLASLPSRLDRSSALRAMQTDARITANTQRLLQRAPVHLIMMAFGIAILGVINPIALTAVAAFSLVAAIPYVILSRRAHEISRNFEQSAYRLTDTKRGWLNRIIMESGHDADEDSDSHIRQVVSHTSMREFMSLFEARVNILSQSSAIGGLISSITVAIVTAIFAWQAVKGHLAWSFVILHFVALQFVFRAVSRVTSLAVSANRFGTQIQRYFAFISGEKRAENGSLNARKGEKGDGPNLPVALRIAFDDGDTLDYRLETGQRTFIVANAHMDRFEIYRFVLALGFEENRALRFLDRPNFVTLGKAENIDPSTVSQAPETAAEIATILGDQTEPTSPAARFVWLVLNEARHSSGVLFIEQRGLILLDAEQVGRLLDTLRSLHVLVYATRAVARKCTWGVEKALLYDGTRIRGYLDINDVLENRNLVLQAITPAVGPVETDIIDQSGETFGSFSDI